MEIGLMNSLSDPKLQSTTPPLEMLPLWHPYSQKSGDKDISSSGFAFTYHSHLEEPVGSSPMSCALN